MVTEYIVDVSYRLYNVTDESMWKIKRMILKSILKNSWTMRDVRCKEGYEALEPFYNLIKVEVQAKQESLNKNLPKR